MTPSQPLKNRPHLFMLCSHIGNPADIPPRALFVIKTADLLVFEEERPAKLILKCADIHREYLKFSEHRQKETLQMIKEAMQAGRSIAYMSDQGSPNIADPGGEILQLAYAHQAKITVIPGPSSITAALSAYPKPFTSFHYAGFLKRDAAARDSDLTALKRYNCPIILLDTPYRRQALLSAAARVLGKDWVGMLAVDISGEAEDYIFADLKALEKKAEPLAKLNFVLIVQRA